MSAEINYRANARREVSEYSENIIKLAMKLAGIETLDFSSTRRTIEDQARIMYENIAGLDVDSVAQLVSKRGWGYASAGRSVEEVYFANKNKDKSDVLVLMQNKIQSLLDKGQRASRHCADLDTYNSYNVFDIPYSCVPEDKEEDFECILAGMSKKVVSSASFQKKVGLKEVIDVLIIENECWHIEISQDNKSALPNAKTATGVPSFPVALSKGRTVTEESVGLFYRHTEEASNGGFFPVGANTVWHGGVHLYVPKGKEVRACLQGRIVAARLAESKEASEGPYGSRNFILVKHGSDEQVFYSLYMHLNALRLSRDESFIKRLNWLGETLWYTYTGSSRYKCRTAPVDGKVLDERISKGDKFELIEHVDPAPWKKVRTKKGDEVFVGIPDEHLKVSYQCEPDESLLDKLRSGDVVKLDIRVSGDQLLWESGEYGDSDHRTGLLHWEIFSENNIFPPSREQETDSGEETATDEPGPSDEGKTVRALLVRAVDGPLRAYPEMKVTYRASRFNVSNPSAKEKQQVNWLVTADGVEVIKKEKHGDTLTFEIAYEWKGKTLKVMPYRNKPADKFSVVTQVAHRKPILWKAIEDTDSDFNMDSEVILNLFADDQEDGLWESDENLTAEELKKFYSKSPKAQRLRAYACRFVSEWGIRDLDSAIDKLKGRWITFGLKDRIEPYLWWNEAKDAGCDLPKSPMCWHYNPISVLETLHLGEGMPVVRREHPATDRSAIRIGVFFDGTGNNMANDIAKGKDTNIVRLYELYDAKADEQSASTIYHDGAMLSTHKIYVNGVGTEDGVEENSGYDMATGGGGVSRIDDAMDRLQSFLESVSGIDGPRIVDVFGFSRGASLARDFINNVNKKLSEEGVKVGFVGLFDTVGSFGLAGNKENPRSDNPLVTGVASYVPPTALLTRLVFGEYELDLCADSAEKIVQLVAEDEIRANFPLSSLKPSENGSLPANMEEITVVGVHSDVGGSYGIKTVDELDRVEKRKIYYQRVGPAEHWSAHLMQQKNALEEEAAQRGLELLYEDDSTSDIVGNTTDTYWLVKHRKVKPSLSNVYLHLMFTKAIEAKVPFRQISVFEAKEPARFSIPAELVPLFEADLETCIDPDKIRKEYVHTSYCDWEDSSEEKRWIANRANGDGKRTKYYNDPDEAVVPEKPVDEQRQDKVA